MSLQSSLGMAGGLKVKKIKAPGPPLSWRLKNKARWDYALGLAGNSAAKGLSRVTGLPTFTSELKAILVKANGTKVNYGVISRRLVTTAFVDFMVDQLQADTTEWGDFKYHDSGEGVTGANITDVDIETTDGESRATGSQEEGASSNIYKSIGTIPYTSTKAITEHGLFSQSTGTTLMDRHTFSAINVENGDSIQFTYELTVSSGG